MKIYDRYSNTIVSAQNIPDHIDFGRYTTLKNDESIKDELTYSIFNTNKVIHQELLLEKNKSVQDLFIDILIDSEKAQNIDFEIIPLIRRIKNKLGLNEFEELLYDKLFHIEEIFRVPHYILNRTIEKVHVSRAKRIASKSYQYLASHTEDWVHKSIVSFRPSRILNEELELNYNIYENHLTVGFIERCLIYLNSRLKEIQDIKSFISDYKKLLQNRSDDKGWYKKTRRNLSLIGSVYEDEHYTNNRNDGTTLSQTEEKLSQINRRLLVLRKRELFEAVNRRATESVTLRNTNVLVNHKHYRYIKTLWIELDKVKPEQSETDKIKLEQDVVKGLRVYAKSLIRYVLIKNLDYELRGNYMNFEAEHIQLSKIQFKENKKGFFELSIGSNLLKIIVIGNQPNIDREMLKKLKRQNIYILYYNDKKNIENTRLIGINPLDPDSVERIGILIRKYLLSDFLSEIHRAYKFKQMLKEYVEYLPRDFLEFNVVNFTYKFHSFPSSTLSFDSVSKELEENRIFINKSRSIQKDIKDSMNELINEIEKNATKLKDDYLNCFNCSNKYKQYNTQHLNYLECQSCRCLIDSSQSENMMFKINDDKYLKLAPADFGIDYIIYNNAEL